MVFIFVKIQGLVVNHESQPIESNPDRKVVVETVQKQGHYLTAQLKTWTIYDSGLQNGNYLHIANRSFSVSLKILCIVCESGVRTHTFLITALTHCDYLPPPSYLIMSPKHTTLLLKTSGLSSSIWSADSLSRPIFTDQ